MNRRQTIRENLRPQQINQGLVSVDEISLDLPSHTAEHLRSRERFVIALPVREKPNPRHPAPLWERLQHSSGLPVGISRTANGARHRVVLGF